MRTETKIEKLIEKLHSGELHIYYRENIDNHYPAIVIDYDAEERKVMLFIDVDEKTILKFTADFEELEKIQN